MRRMAKKQNTGYLFKPVQGEGGREKHNDPFVTHKHDDCAFTCTCDTCDWSRKPWLRQTLLQWWLTILWCEKRKKRSGGTELKKQTNILRRGWGESSGSRAYAHMCDPQQRRVWPYWQKPRGKPQLLWTYSFWCYQTLPLSPGLQLQPLHKSLSFPSRYCYFVLCCKIWHVLLYFFYWQ